MSDSKLDAIKAFEIFNHSYLSSGIKEFNY